MMNGNWNALKPVTPTTILLVTKIILDTIPQGIVLLLGFCNAVCRDNVKKAGTEEMESAYIGGYASIT